MLARCLALQRKPRKQLVNSFLILIFFYIFLLYYTIWQSTFLISLSKKYFLYNTSLGLAKNLFIIVFKEMDKTNKIDISAVRGLPNYLPTNMSHTVIANAKISNEEMLDKADMVTIHTSLIHFCASLRNKMPTIKPPVIRAALYLSKYKIDNNIRVFLIFS